MEVTGKIIHKLELQSGTSKAGNAWRKQEYVLETQESYPKKVHFDFFGDRIDQYPLNVGDTIKLSFDIESREYQGKWFTSIRGWKSEKVEGSTISTDAQNNTPATQTYTAPQVDSAPDFAIGNDEPTDDLPF
ncbi:MAG: DUF3127 domain-containing protein [Muribaculaceae bacterium]|nr:DUF3127 domain-containing protein [Muribaculaceae bacterium]